VQGGSGHLGGGDLGQEDGVTAELVDEAVPGDGLTGFRALAWGGDRGVEEFVDGEFVEALLQAHRLGRGLGIGGDDRAVAESGQGGGREVAELHVLREGALRIGRVHRGPAVECGHGRRVERGDGQLVLAAEDVEREHADDGEDDDRTGPQGRAELLRLCTRAAEGARAGTAVGWGESTVCGPLLPRRLNASPPTTARTTIAPAHRGALNFFGSGRSGTGTRSWESGSTEGSGSVRRRPYRSRSGRPGFLLLIGCRPSSCPPRSPGL